MTLSLVKPTGTIQVKTLEPNASGDAIQELYKNTGSLSVTILQAHGVARIIPADISDITLAIMSNDHTQTIATLDLVSVDSNISGNNSRRVEWNSPIQGMGITLAPGYSLVVTSSTGTAVWEHGLVIYG